ncbi:hypothetical protein NHX12_020108 [Muraenolepis orangiensis]|uniref:Uncharacterized protein n=1 Tax=Muraenolepis orangiensis TaxID=630683 RepID=A0A9Q0EV91_9TELE|nr:hypothetical protein NHX12_020108 [Muraenolepis orangiensis]
MNPPTPGDTRRFHRTYPRNVWFKTMNGTNAQAFGTVKAGPVVSTSLQGHTSRHLSPSSQPHSDSPTRPSSSIEAVGVTSAAVQRLAGLANRRGFP